jgi:hypothetical protein
MARGEAVLIDHWTYQGVPVFKNGFPFRGDRYDTKSIWYHIARIREAAGDLEGAARARQSARIFPNAKLRRRHP